MNRSNSKSWQAVLTPHRSLGQSGFFAIMIVIISANFLVGIIFFMQGAWPVLGFAGLDVLLIWWAFRANFADAHRSERIVITEHELVLERINAGTPPQEERFVRRWVRFGLEEDPQRELVGNLFLIFRGRRTVFGTFLPPEEKRELAKALRAALSISRI
jgi:uncharacterized membrane protein